jgi:hypothetical protein
LLCLSKVPSKIEDSILEVILLETRVKNLLDSSLGPEGI